MVDIFHKYLYSIHFLLLYFYCKHVCRRQSLEMNATWTIVVQKKFSKIGMIQYIG